LEKEAVDEN
jgi:hypothetical protein